MIIFILSQFLPHGSADGVPVGQSLEGAAYRLHMPEHEQEHEGTAYQTGDAIELFDGHEHAVEHGEGQTADEVVGDMAAQ